MDEMQVIWVIGIGIACIGPILHATGMIAIHLSTNKSNQTIIILNLSIADMFGLWHRILVTIYKYVTYDPNLFEDQRKMLNLLFHVFPSPYDDLESAAFICIVFQVICIMTVLTLDRLVCVTKPMLYRYHVTRSLIKHVLIGCWLFSITVGIISGVFSSLRWFIVRLLLIVATAYFLLTVVTYVILFIRIQSSRRSESNR